MHDHSHTTAALKSCPSATDEERAAKKEQRQGRVASNATTDGRPCKKAKTSAEPRLTPLSHEVPTRDLALVNTNNSMVDR